MGILIVALDWLLRIIEFAIFVRVIISWFPISRDNQLIYILYQLTEPILGPIRRLVERSSMGGGMMMLDFSPIIAFVLIDVLRRVLYSILLRI